MGKRGNNLFRAIKKVFSPESKQKKGQKSKNSGLERPTHSDPCSSEIPQSISSNVVSPPPTHSPVFNSEEVKLAEVDLQPSKQVNATVAIASAALAPAQSATQIVQLTTSTIFAGKSREEASAIKIQTAFRGYLARRALRALRGLVRLKSLVHGNAVKRQATTTLRCMQTLARVQSQIRSRRIRMIEENQTLQRQLLLKRERELENLRMSEEWDDSTQSKEQIEAGLLSKQEAGIRRERALAYAFSHQWKNSKSVNPTFMDPNNPHWGWSWLERWMSARPWECRSTADKELTTNGGEIIKAYARRDNNNNLDGAVTPQKSTHPPPRRHSTGTPRSMASSVSTTKVKSASSRNIWAAAVDDDNISLISMQSERPRRHSIAGSTIGDDESLASSPAIPSYMAPTRSARAKTRSLSQSPLSDGNIQTATDKEGSAGSVKKRLSFPNSPSAAAAAAAVRLNS